MQSRYAGTVKCHFAMEIRFWLWACTRLKNTAYGGYWWNFWTQTARGKDWHFTNKDLENSKDQWKAWERHTKTCMHWRERNNCGWTGKPMKAKSQKQTHRSTRQISKETDLAQCSIVQIIHCVFCLKCFSFTSMLAAYYCHFLYIYISQGSVATPLRCGEIVNNHFIANCTRNVQVKKLWKSINIWQRYEQ